MKFFQKTSVAVIFTVLMIAAALFIGLSPALKSEPVPEPMAQTTAQEQTASQTPAAEQTSNTAGDETISDKYIRDGAGLFTRSGESAIQDHNKKIYSKTGSRIAILTTDSTGSETIESYTNSAFDSMGLSEYDMLFAIGPAGSGKTYTAIALAVRALKNKEVKKIILSRPAVEAGEKLGFLPGDMKDKIDPYLQPLYDALQEMIPAAKLQEYLDTNVIQIAPLAFMRGRTLNDAVVILDEAQNTTSAQIKMFLTRMGWNTKMIVTGDLTQIDLPKGINSGLKHAVRILKDIDDIGIIRLTDKDVVRHPLVQQIVKAYEQNNE